MRSFQTKQSVNKTNVSDGLFKQVTQQNLPKNRKQAEIHSNVLKPGMYRIATTTTQNREPQLPHASRNTNPHVSKSSGVNPPLLVLGRPQLKYLKRRVTLELRSLRDGENLDKMKEKGDPCVMVGYSTQSKGYRVYNKRTRLIVESIHIKFDEIKEMMSDHNSSDLAPQRQEMSVENNNVVPAAEKTDSSQQGLEFLFSPLLEEYYNPSHGQAEENNNDQAPNASFQEDEFINPFCTWVQEIGESSSCNIDNTDVHSFHHKVMITMEQRSNPSKQVRGNPTMPVQNHKTTACYRS
ncbi:hypothetical protein Tco_1157148 [Tanacetum coccineum]